MRVSNRSTTKREVLNIHANAGTRAESTVFTVSPAVSTVLGKVGWSATAGQATAQNHAHTSAVGLNALLFAPQSLTEDHEIDALLRVKLR
jgi:hypothetical protein